MPPSAPLLLTRRRLSFGLWLTCAACRPEAPPEPPAPAPSSTAASAPAPSGPSERDPDQIVATVDGVSIREAELDELAKGIPSPPARSALVLALVERRLLEHEAEGLGIRVLEHELDEALRTIASSNGLTPEQLREAVVETTPLSWPQYRLEVAYQLLEARVLLPLVPPVPNADARPDALTAELEATRARLVGCLRARATIEIHDAAVTLPDNAFGVLTTVEGFAFRGDPVLPTAELEAVAKPVSEGRLLCDSVQAAELAMQQLYLDRGYLDATVRIPWPPNPQAAMTLDVDTSAGQVHTIGTLRFDQSAAPAAKRLRERDLLRELRKHAKPGNTATMSTMQAATEAMRAMFDAAGLGPVEVDVKRRDVDDGVRIDLTFRLVGDRT